MYGEKLISVDSPPNPDGTTVKGVNDPLAVECLNLLASFCACVRIIYSLHFCHHHPLLLRILVIN